MHDHISALAGLDDEAFSRYVKRLKRRVSRNNTEAMLTRRTIDQAMKGLQEAPDRDEVLRHLLAPNCSTAAAALLERLVEELPPPVGRIRLDILPTAGARGTGNSSGDGRLLVTVPAKGQAIPWLGFVIAHEYSHIIRDFDTPSQTVRDFLISEGLAMVLAETFATKPQPYPWDEVSPEEEAEFWRNVDRDARGLEGYVSQMNSETAYEAGARVVRSYMKTHRVSVVESHRRSFEELYWDSGYRFIR